MIGTQVANYRIEEKIRKGADARVRLLGVKESGRFKGTAEMHVELVSVTIGGRAYRVQSRRHRRQAGRRPHRSGTAWASPACR